MVLRRVAGVAMLSSLGVATAVSVVWVVVSEGVDLFEPAAQTLGLVAALTAVVAERLAAERQRRLSALSALVDELRKNRTVIADLGRTLRVSRGRRVYPRLLISATDSVLTSGALAAAGDRELLTALHRWRDEVADFNRRLDLTELLTFLVDTPEVIHGFGQALGRDDGRLRQVELRLSELLGVLTGAEVLPGVPAPRSAAHLVEPARVP